MKHLPYAFNTNKEANESCLTLCLAHLYTRGIFQFKDVLKNAFQVHLLLGRSGAL